jgi:hypothetical protein
MGDLNDPTKNVTLYDENGNQVELILDGAIWRLAVDALITGGNFQLQPFLPDFHYSIAGTALNTSTDTVLYTESGTGKIDFICVAGSNSNFEIAIDVDGTEVLRIPMSDLATLGLSNATNVPIWAETANKNFRYSPKQGVDFTTEYTLSAKSTTTPVTTVNWLINDRKEAP